MMRIVVLSHSSVASTYFCRQIGKRHQLVGVFVEDSPASKVKKAITQFRRNRKKKGLWYALARWLEIPFVIWLDRSYRRRMERFFRGLLEGESTDPTPVRVESVNDPAIVASVRELRPDIICVFGTSILREAMISTASKGVINMHTGILPHYRGAKSEFWALAQGDVQNVGVTLHKIDLGVDTGPILGQARVEVKTGMDDRDLRCQTILAGTELLLRILDTLEADGEPLVGAKQGKGRSFSTPTLPAYFRLKRNLRTHRTGF